MSHPGVICGTCGRDNAPNLVFCQDCGARLGPRVSPPTPAILPSYDAIPQEPAAGATERKPPSDVLLTPSPSRAIDSGLADVDALLGGPGSERSPELESPKETRSRPSAPNFDFSPRDKNEKPPPSLGAEEPPTRSQCSRCGASNAVHIRYCLKCGHQLRSSMGPSGPASARPQMTETAAANPPPPSTRNPEEPRAAEQPIAPLPVLGVGQIPPSASTVRICTRCRGVCDSRAQFCKFCGASLVDASLASRPLSAPPPLVDRGVEQKKAEALDPPTPAVSFDVPAAPRVPNMGAAGARPGVALEAPALSKPEPPRPGAKPQLGRLIVIAKDGGEGQSWPIGERLDVGRSEGDVLVPDDGYLSPRHARLSWRNGRLFLRDLGTVNGVYLRLAAKDASQAEKNGEKSAENARNGASGERDRGSISLRLEDQDLILIGQQVIRFEVVKDAEEGLGPASQHGTLVFGTPVAPRYARLCLRTVEGVTRDVYYLGKRETILGRESGDIIFAEDPFLSRRHAAIHVHEGESKKRSFSLFDFGSSNGTFVQIRGEAPLASGDEFRVGQQLFRVELTA